MVTGFDAIERPVGCEDCGTEVPTPGNIEGARILGNHARHALLAAGLDELEIVQRAEDWIAERRDGEMEDFLAWAERCHRCFYPGDDAHDIWAA